MVAVAAVMVAAAMVVAVMVVAVMVAVVMVAVAAMVVAVMVAVVTVGAGDPNTSHQLTTKWKGLRARRPFTSFRFPHRSETRIPAT